MRKRKYIFQWQEMGNQNIFLTWLKLKTVM